MAAEGGCGQARASAHPTTLRAFATCPVIWCCAAASSDMIARNGVCGVRLDGTMVLDHIFSRESAWPRSNNVAILFNQPSRMTFAGRASSRATRAPMANSGIRWRRPVSIADPPAPRGSPIPRMSNSTTRWKVQGDRLSALPALQSGRAVASTPRMPRSSPKACRLIEEATKSRRSPSWLKPSAAAPSYFHRIVQGRHRADAEGLCRRTPRRPGPPGPRRRRQRDRGDL